MPHMHMQSNHKTWRNLYLFVGPSKVIPYLNASLNWIVKCGKHLEFVLSPTIALCPSEFDYSFVQLGEPTDINPWLTNYFVSLGIGYRF
jgi:hypothetical protein